MEETIEKNARLLTAIGVEVPVGGWYNGKPLYKGCAFALAESISRTAGAKGLISINLETLAIRPQDLSVRGDWMTCKCKLRNALMRKLAKVSVA